MSTAPVSTFAPLALPQPPAKPAEPVGTQLSEAAQQFEAILLRQMLASARTTDFGGSDVFGKSDETFREMRDARFAEIAARSGQLGFAAAIERQLSRHLPRDQS